MSRKPSTTAARAAVTPRETLHPDERRRALESMAFDPDVDEGRIDPMVLGAVGLAAVDPVGERFTGEGEALAHVAAREAAGRDEATRILADSAIKLW